MRAFHQIGALRAFVRGAREDGKTVGFVPTMGALHDGHLALVRQARSDCDVVVTSVFVNPTQFGPGEDFERYPRTLDADSKALAGAGIDAIFAPDAAVMYPPGFQTVVTVPGVAARWEGERRPGHFAGVATVVAKLLNIVQADRAYFGQKDYQQLRVIERLVADLSLPVTIVCVPTVREPDGLAMSSRNRYLGADERLAAASLWRSLAAALSRYEAGCRSGPEIEAAVRAVLSMEPLVDVSYVAAVDADTLEPLERVSAAAVVLVAARVGTTHLIDNATLGASTSGRPKRGG